MPPGINVFTLSDRTQTIRASVADVQFTLLITILLVVMVIFVFLRSFWATIIPSVTVPLALLGACALMWPRHAMDSRRRRSTTRFTMHSASARSRSISRSCRATT
jgi:Cu/Ag efflux pump CusA